MLKIVNLTQHKSTKDQNVTDLEGKEAELLVRALTFDDMPSQEAINNRASVIASLAVGFDAAMIGGAPYLMAPLEQALIKRGIAPYYAFSRRISEEREDEYGIVHKINVFKHEGFVVACAAGQDYKDSLVEDVTSDDYVTPCYPDDGIEHPIEVV
jgi:hypothetical protein